MSNWLAPMGEPSGQITVQTPDDVLVERMKEPGIDRWRTDYIRVRREEDVQDG